MSIKPRLIAAIALVAAATLGMTACASTGNSPSATGGAKKTHTITFIPGIAGDGFYVTLECGIRAEAKKFGDTVTVQGGPKFDPTVQIPIVSSVVASKPDALLIAPDSVDAMQAPIQAAVTAGIKVALVDTTLSDPSIAVTAVSSDNLGGGKAAFDSLAKLVPGGGTVLVMNTTAGTSTTDLRAKGFNDEAATNPKFKVLPVQFDQDSPTTAAALITADLAAHPDLVGVFATNLFSANGVATGLRQAGKQSSVKVVGFDADPSQIDALKAGTVQSLIAQDPFTIGADAVDQIENSFAGKPVTKSIQTGSHEITAANLATDGAKWIYKASC
jgi:ribose transport system substrate-binding protein